MEAHVRELQLIEDEKSLASHEAGGVDLGNGRLRGGRLVIGSQRRNGYPVQVLPRIQENLLYLL